MAQYGPKKLQGVNFVYSSKATKKYILIILVNLNLIINQLEINNGKLNIILFNIIMSFTNFITNFIEIQFHVRIIIYNHFIIFISLLILSIFSY